MKKYMKWALVLPLTASLMLASCDKDEEEIKIPTPPPIDNPVEGKVLIGEATSDDANIDVRIYADEDIFVGYNKIYTILLEKGTMNQIMEAEIKYMPMMAMNSGMNHACPVENPTETKPVDGLFEGAIVFVMPTGTMGDWTLGIDVKGLSSGLEGMVEIIPTVIEPDDARMFSFVSPVDSKKIFISYLEPSDPQVGMNDFIVTAHQKAGMMDWPALTDLNIEFEPMMPSMGHGSPNNENPVHMMNGHYQGLVNFTMSGFWQLNMTIKDSQDAVLDDTHAFDVNF